MSEQIDIYSPGGGRTGIASREEAHRRGLWHRTFHCWFLLERRGKHYLIFQQRGRDKKDFPGLLDCTAAGHLTAGEKDRDGVREVLEELGVDVRFEALLHLGDRCHVQNREGFCNCEIRASTFGQPLLFKATGCKGKK